MSGLGGWPPPCRQPRRRAALPAAFRGNLRQVGKTDAILSSAAAHHRLLLVHPFLDGNGRVARLMSHAILLDTLDTGAVWSVARGLARNVQAYKEHLANCDQPRRNDLDGRGNLSEEALAEFTQFFLSTCIDQVTFMESLVRPDRLRARTLLWAEEEIRLGDLPRSQAASWKPSFIAARCRAVTLRASSAPRTAMRAASSGPSSKRAF